MLVNVTAFQGILCAEKGRFPYIASIRRPGSHPHVCTGILVGPEYVLTAAHCVDPSSQYSAGKLPFVRIGVVNVDDRDDPDAEVMLVERSFIHPGWNADRRQRSTFNIALLKLAKASKHRVPNLLLDHFNLITGQRLAAVGWGSGTNGPDLGADVFGSLKIEPQEFVDSGHCNRSTLWNGAVGDGIICGLNQAKKASCVVDSGSPLLLLDMPKNEVERGDPGLDFMVGINVDGAVCNEPGKPDMYVDIRVHMSWIEKTMIKSKKRSNEL